MSHSIKFVYLTCWLIHLSGLSLVSGQSQLNSPAKPSLAVDSTLNLSSSRNRNRLTATRHTAAPDQLANVVHEDKDLDSDWFEKNILPILNDHCLECHSHDSGTIEGDLALDSRSGWKIGGQSGPAIVPNAPDKSLLLRAIKHQTEPTMPPDDKLSDEQIKLFEEWINRGAPDPRVSPPQMESQKNPRDWWSLRPLVKPEFPTSGTADKSLHPIDRFITASLRAEGLEMTSTAAPIKLLKRLFYSLHGLPPTPAQVDQWAKALGSDQRAQSWESLIEQLLKSPRYGERWGRHWLDTVHFADTHGCEHDVLRPNAWPYRDYVIQSFNNDTKWARFIKEQLAADHFYPEQEHLMPALGFISAGPLELSRAGTAPVTFDYLDRDDIVSQTMAAFASTTANCARCHDHKFDPISQADYYALQAVFAGGGKGIREYDANHDVKNQRKKLDQLLTRINKRDATLLRSDNTSRLVQTFETDIQNQAVWIPFDLATFKSEQGATLKQLSDGSVLASGHNPATDTYIIDGTGQGTGTGKGSDRKLQTISAIRIDVLPHESLPAGGPGRCANGNLHLNEIEFQIVNAESKTATSISIASASADWDQQGWTIQHAIDGNNQSAWGIYPEVAKPHHAVFQFPKPVSVDENSKVTIRLHQTHGGSHLIGRFKVYVTDSKSHSIRVLPDTIRHILAIEPEKRTPAQQLDLAIFALRIEVEKELSSIPTPQKVYAWSRFYSHAKKQAQPLAPKTVHVLKRGNIHRPGEVSTPGSLSVINELTSRFSSSVDRDESFRRAALANWLADRDNPLVWRSVVNRVWTYHFGRGLCDSPNDFGRMGALPSHPELLDWLAVWFRDEARGSLKELHKLILTSQAWQQDSKQPDAKRGTLALELDSANSLIWKSNIRKLDAESFRDSILQISGAMDWTMGGPGIEQFSKTKGRQSTPQLDYDAFDWASTKGHRRAIYRVVWRGIADPFMESLDFPDLGLLTGKREKSSSPLQALSTFNNDFVLHFSSVLANKLANKHPRLPDQVEQACRLIWLRPPSGDEKSTLVRFAEQHSLAALCRVLFNSNEFIFIR